jgi:hypothetical protein
MFAICGCGRDAVLGDENARPNKPSVSNQSAKEVKSKFKKWVQLGITLIITFHFLSNLHNRQLNP